MAFKKILLKVNAFIFQVKVNERGDKYKKVMFIFNKYAHEKDKSFSVTKTVQNVYLCILS